MQLQHHPINTLKQDILQIAGRHLDTRIYKMFFFGSRVTDLKNDRSDIDVGINGPKPLSFSTLASIEADLVNLPILYKIEVVDFNRVSKKFQEVALQKIEPIN